MEGQTKLGWVGCSTYRVGPDAPEGVCNDAACAEHLCPWRPGGGDPAWMALFDVVYCYRNPPAAGPCTAKLPGCPCSCPRKAN